MLTTTPSIHPSAHVGSPESTPIVQSRPCCLGFYQRPKTKEKATGGVPPYPPATCARAWTCRLRNGYAGLPLVDGLGASIYVLKNRRRKSIDSGFSQLCGFAFFGASFMLSIFFPHPPEPAATSHPFSITRPPPPCPSPCPCCWPQPQRGCSSAAAANRCGRAPRSGPRRGAARH